MRTLRLRRMFTVNHADLNGALGKAMDGFYRRAVEQTQRDCSPPPS